MPIWNPKTKNEKTGKFTGAYVMTAEEVMDIIDNRFSWEKRTCKKKENVLAQKNILKKAQFVKIVNFIWNVLLNWLRGKNG